MSPGRKIDPNIRIAKSLTGGKPTPYISPEARQQQHDEARAKQIAERLAEIRAVPKDERESS